MTKSKQQGQQQRVFSESDETQLLKTLRKVSKSSISSSCNSPPSSFTVTSKHLDLIEASLGHRFGHNQIIDKLRRLKLKYHRQARTKSLIKTPHDLLLHKISRKIWGRSYNYFKRHVIFSLAQEGEEPAVVGLENFPFLREEFSRIFPENGIWEKGLVCLGAEKMRSFNEQWMLVRKEEAGLKARKAELEKEFIDLVVEAFPSSSISPTGL